ncbi:hypothetical protein [Pseudoxanthomonas indica]|uniref:Transmembrane protein n=1 Tax=Pseudoxanthomonas indica TaxID=428993 RepID=A0A1T5KMJ1_9GAMM|nr:hypothetical protein [Pseudoxanthomonas indica]GGD50114.1 hypothetical protein GCM10007235_22670 [Pseudoxanthomonas indica]SKC64705.1 hypothetical protein SAMN06296058_1814 [Pseudoxanthomonas indica]
MSKLTIITDRALDLVNQAGSGIVNAGQSLKHAVPEAGKLLQTGAALGVAKTGARTAMTFVRRNPVVAVAAAAGVGLLAFAAYRKRKRDAANAPVEGKSRRIEARKVNGTGRAGRARTTARKSSSESASP